MSKTALLMIDFQRDFCGPGGYADRFAGIDWEFGRGGAPLLTDALATLECEIVAEHPTGDHWIVIGQVDNLHISPIKDPLLFFAGGFGTLQPLN